MSRTQRYQATENQFSARNSLGSRYTGKHW